MDDQPHSARRKFLRYAVAFLGGVGATFASIPFIRSWRNKQPMPTLDVDIAKMVDGQLLAVNWPFGPSTVYILKRSRDTLQTLGSANPVLADPNSEESEQPEAARNPLRSLRPEFLVVAAHCTHLGCNVGYVPKGQNEWFPSGGFMCPCHGSKYDFSGRVHKHVPAPYNLVVPNYKFTDENTIQIGRE